MTTVNVSDETRVRLTNRKTYELSSVDKVINNILDRIEGVKPTEMPETVSVALEQDAQTEIDPSDSVAIMDRHLENMNKIRKKEE